MPWYPPAGVVSSDAPAPRDAADARQCCDMLQRHVVSAPGCLSATEALDVDGGDGWTPLMEAVSRRNIAVAAALVTAGADVHKTCRGLSAAFWATALQLDDDVDGTEHEIYFPLYRPLLLCDTCASCCSSWMRLCFAHVRYHPA